MSKYNESTRTKKAIDKILESIRTINTNASGTDVTKTVKIEAKKQIREHAKRIKEIDLEFWEMTFGVEV